MPKVTVLMAVYNAGRYVGEAIESVLGQTLQDFELLIVNDGSTDDTREIVLAYDDSRIRLVENERNCGQTRSLNRGLKLASGEFIARQDADDISEPERLGKQLAFLETHSDVALLGTWYRKIDADGTVIGDRTLPCDGTELRWCLLFYTPFVHSAIMVRRSVLVEEIGEYNEAVHAQDYELWSRIAAVRPVANLGEFLVRFRIHPSSMTATYGESIEAETDLVRVGTVRRLPGWRSAGDIGDDVRRYRAMRGLLFESASLLDPRDVPAALGDLHRLSAAFCDHYRLDNEQRRAHRAYLARQLSGRLIHVAADCLRADNRLTALRLLLRACRVRQRALLQRRWWLTGMKAFRRRRRTPIMSPDTRTRPGVR